jgi:hypothetical protein
MKSASGGQRETFEKVSLWNLFKTFLMGVGSESLKRFSADAPCKSVHEQYSSENPFPNIFSLIRAKGGREAPHLALA